MRQGTVPNQVCVTVGRDRQLYGAGSEDFPFFGPDPTFHRFAGLNWNRYDLDHRHSMRDSLDRLVPGAPSHGASRVPIVAGQLSLVRSLVAALPGGGSW